MNFSQTECETFCTNRNERIPSVLDFDFDSMDFESILKLYDPDKNARPSIWTDGKFDYKIQKWLDTSGEPIPDGFWEKSVWLRKAYFIANLPILQYNISPYKMTYEENEWSLLIKILSDTTIYTNILHFNGRYRCGDYAIFRILLFPPERKRQFGID